MSCNVAVENELVPELEDTHGTTRGTKLSVLHISVYFLPCLSIVGFCPLTHSYENPCSSHSFHSDRSARRDPEYLHNHKEAKIVNIYFFASSLVCSVTTMEGSRDLRRCFISSELKSFLIRMCIETPKPITNSPSSRDFKVIANVARTSRGE